ncbi:MAG: ATP synthase F0 subunit B [Terriglobales bacterium]|jgi:F-type H+-transporting ATPase subunit b
MTMKAIIRSLLTLALTSSLWLVLTHVSGHAQEQPAQASAQTSSENSGPEKPAQPNDQGAQQESQHPSIGRELATETREAEGEEEENSKLKHSVMVQKLAKLTGLSVHGAHLLALGLNFAIIVFLVFWLGRKSVPGMLRKRSESIQKALDEARKASQDANQRLADIEKRLRQMDTEIGTMQGSAEKEAQGEEVRIQKAAEDEIRKVVQAAEQEIAAAAKQARRELSTHTADLAIALARKQINVDSNTDQVLVRDFAAKLASNAPSRDKGGKDGR